MNKSDPRLEDRMIASLPKLRRFAITLCGSRELADDLVQTACEKALANAAGFEPGSSFDAWIFKILRNSWLDILRRRRTAGHVVDIAEIQEIVGTSGEKEMEAKLLVGSVHAAIGRLPADQREVLILVCVDELSYREAAEVIGVPVGTVMSRLFRARENLARSIGIMAPGDRFSPKKGDAE